SQVYLPTQGNSSNNHLGINVSAPAARLHIQDNPKMTNQLCPRDFVECQLRQYDASANQISAIRNHLKNRDEPIFRYMLIDSYLASGDIAQAQNELALIDSECEMSEDSEQELTGMTTWYGIVDDNLENLHDLSSADNTALTTLAQDPSDYRASGLARTLLELNDAPVDYTEPVYFPGQVNNKRANQVSERPESVQTKFSLSPNPARDKIRLTWSSEELYPVKEMEVQITDMQGKVMLQQQLSDVSLEMTLFNLNGFINGSYILEVRHEENTLYSEKFILKK
ncbi:MAG: T9SS type A sorting domain-containing protein, partial [Schleiferiaceae bacterium]|nr:T9SS type A sorting domain-containing protein [Schleiferiaceae bacterium]